MRARHRAAATRNQRSALVKGRHMAAKTQMRDLALALLALFVSSMPGFAAAAAVPAESLESLHDKAKSEGGKLTLYMPLSNRAMEVIPPAFMKRFPA